MSKRALATIYLAVVGVGSLIYWILVRPGFGTSATQSEWRTVIGFSSFLLLLGFAYPILGWVVGKRRVVIASLVPAAALVLNSVENVLEDGVGVEELFIVFVAATGLFILGSVVLAALIASVPGRRLFALVPSAGVVGVLLYVLAGGPILAATWLFAAALIVTTSRSTPSTVIPRPHVLGHEESDST